MDIHDLKVFYLCGGTALALQIGHRLSYDLDIFSDSSIDNNEIIDFLTPLHPFQLLNQSRNILSLNIRNIKVDFVKYPYKLIYPLYYKDNLRIASIRDIAAMKLAAITNRGRKRDFIDMFFIFKKFPLKETLDFYGQKFPDGNQWLVLKSLTYFADAEEDIMPVLLKKKIEWNKVKDYISKEVKKIVL